MQHYVILLCAVAACVAMPHPGPPAPPAPPLAPPMAPPMAPPALGPQPGHPGAEKMAAPGTDLKGEETLYLANPYAYSAYNLRALPGGSGSGLGYVPYASYGLQYGYNLPAYPYYY